MPKRLRFPTGGSNNKDSGGNGTTSIFANISAMSVMGSGNSIIQGSSGIERAAAAAAANSQYTPADGEDLPPGWRLVSSRSSGRDYYLHLATGSTQWDKPTEAEPKKGVEQAVPYQKPTHVTSVFTNGVSRVGAGITSMFSQANSRLQTTLQNTTVASSSSLAHSSSSGSQSRLGSSQLRSSQEIDREGQMLVEIYENERLDGKLLPQDPKKYSDKHAAPGTGHDAIPEGELPEGHEWVTEWEIDRNYTAVDNDGWTYAADFVEIVRLLRDDLSHASRHPTDAVRRRRWIRYRQSPDDVPSSPRESNEAKSLGSSSTSNNWGESSNGGTLSESSGYGYLDENDDPFHRTAQKQQSGFRVNMKFPHRGNKDNTKDYQSINLTDVMWLVNAHDVQNAPTDELMREKTANLEEQIKEATTRSVTLEKDLRAQHDKKSKELVAQQKKFEALVAQYKKIQKENETLQLSVAAHRSTVEALRKEAVRGGIIKCLNDLLGYVLRLRTVFADVSLLTDGERYASGTNFLQSYRAMLCDSIMRFSNITTLSYSNQTERGAARAKRRDVGGEPGARGEGEGAGDGAHALQARQQAARGVAGLGQEAP